MSEMNYELNLFSGQTPVSVKSLSKCLQSIDESLFEEVIDLCKQYLTQKRISKQLYLKLKNSIVSSNGLDANDFDLMINGTLSLAMSCLRVYKSINREMIQNELIKGIHLQTNHCNIFINKLLTDNRVETTFCNSNRQLSRLKAIRWRIDVSISNSMLSRIMEPLIVFELIIINNTIDYNECRIVFECKSSLFHKLRFSTAQLLKEFHLLQQKSVLKN